MQELRDDNGTVGGPAGTVDGYCELEVCSEFEYGSNFCLSTDLWTRLKAAERRQEKYH